MMSYELNLEVLLAECIRGKAAAVVRAVGVFKGELDVFRIRPFRERCVHFAVLVRCGLYFPGILRIQYLAEFDLDAFDGIAVFIGYIAN